MDFKQSDLSFEGVNELLSFAGEVSSTQELQNLLEYTLTHPNYHPSLAPPFLYWKLKRYDEQLEYLLGLSSSEFHCNAEYWCLLGLAQNATGANISDISFSYEKAVYINPLRFDYHYNLANCLRHTDLLKSIVSYRDSIILDSTQPHVWHNYALALSEFGDYSQSLSAFQYSLSLDPFSSDTWINLGLLYLTHRKYNCASRAFEHSIGLDPSLVQPYINLASLYIESRELTAAQNVLSQAAIIHPNSPDVLFNLSLLSLLKGDYTSGWDLYHYRFAAKNISNVCSHFTEEPINSIDDLINLQSPLIIWSEQGLGDSIQFSRYFNLLYSLGISFVFYCPISLVPLFSEWLPISIQICSIDLLPDSPPQSPHIPLLSLPALFKTGLHSIPNELPYLKTTRTTPEEFSFSKPPAALSVGIVWASDHQNKNLYRDKSFPIHLLSPLFSDLIDLGLIELHSLQIGPNSSELSVLEELSGFHDWSNSINSFCDTAHIINQLDLVISVDTAVAHLSGSLNCPTWLILPFNSDFRWLVDRADSPWYPGIMRLFRQPSIGDWLSVSKMISQSFDDLFLLNIKALANAKLSQHSLL